MYRLYIAYEINYLALQYRGLFWKLIVAQFLNEYPIIRAITLLSTVMRGVVAGSCSKPVQFFKTSSRISNAIVPRCLHLCTTNFSIKSYIYTVRFGASQVHMSFYKIHKPTINSLAQLNYCNTVISRNVPLNVKFISCRRYPSAVRYSFLKATRCRNAQQRHV